MAVMESKLRIKRNKLWFARRYPRIWANIFADRGKKKSDGTAQEPLSEEQRAARRQLAYLFIDSADEYF